MKPVLNLVSVVITSSLVIIYWLKLSGFGVMAILRALPNKILVAVPTNTSPIAPTKSGESEVLIVSVVVTVVDHSL